MKIILLGGILASLFASAEIIAREQLSELYQIRSEIKTAVFDRSRYQQDILKAKLDIESQTQEIAKNKIETEKIREKILNRILSLYKMRRAYPQGTLLSFIKEKDFIRKSYYLKYLNSQDKKLVSEYKDRTALNHRLKKKVQSYMKRLVLLQKKNEQRFAELKVRENRQRELIRQIREAIRSQHAAPEDEVAESEKFFSESRGSLELPTDGEITGQLGILRDVKSKLTRLRTGIRIISIPGTDIRSVFDGKVLYVGSIPGWGPTIIIDHGESYYSVYSHIKNLSVRPGDRVITKQKLAEVSSVLYHKDHSDPGLYFEIRHYSEPEDPHLWLKGEQQ